MPDMNHDNSGVDVSTPVLHLLHPEGVIEILRNDWTRKEAPTDAEIYAIKGWVQGANVFLKDLQDPDQIIAIIDFLDSYISDDVIDELKSARRAFQSGLLDLSKNIRSSVRITESRIGNGRASINMVALGILDEMNSQGFQNPNLPN